MIANYDYLLALLSLGFFLLRFDLVHNFRSGSCCLQPLALLQTGLALGSGEMFATACFPADRVGTMQPLALLQTGLVLGSGEVFLRFVIT